MKGDVIHLTHVILWILCLLMILPVNGHVHNSTYGLHCGNITIKETLNTTYHSETDHYHCVQCMFPQNCLESGDCMIGSVGSTCEKCQKSQNGTYYRVGNSCTECPEFPWSVVGFAVYLLVFTIATLCNGFSSSVCTKVKLLCHFLQLLLLTFHLKLPWPDRLLEMFAPLNFAMFTSRIIIPECTFPSWPPMLVYYMEWLVAFAVPVVVVILGSIIDRNMRVKSKNSIRNDDSDTVVPQQKKTTLRRLVVMVVTVMYAPVILSAVRTYLCSDTVPKELVLDHSKDVFLLDNDFSCDNFIFQTIHFVGGLFLIVLGVLFPLMLLFFTLRQKKWDLLYSQWILYSPVYDSYKDRYCFWEGIPLVRKLVSIVITESYPFPPFLQCIVQLGMSGFYLVLLVLLRPYRSCYWVHPLMNIHTIFEVVSTLVLLLAQGLCLSIVMGHYQRDSDLVVVGMVCLVLVLWCVLVFTVPCETQLEIPSDQIEIDDQSEQNKVPRKKEEKFWRKKKVAQDPEYVERVNKNIDHVAF